MTDREVMSDLQFLTGSRHRATILAALSEEPLRPTELCDRVEATRTTVQRILAGFRERTWAEKIDGRYRATLTGRRVHERYRTLWETVERADRLAPLATHLDPFDEPLPAEAFERGTITEATEQEPLAAVDRIVEWLRDSQGDHIETTTPIVANTFNETVSRLLETELSVEMVIDENVLERSMTDFETALERGQTHECVDVWVAPEPLTDGLMVRSDRAAVVAYDETNNVRAVLESDDETVVEWGRRQFERTKDRARPLADVLSERSVEE